MATTEDPRSLSGTDEWRRELYEPTAEREGELFSTISGVENEPLYTPDNVDVDYERDLGYPGVFPFTRGVYPSMYRGRLWTMRQFAGFGTAAETNERFRYLLEHGQTGLSTAFDMPTLMGYDSDTPRSLGEVGREGVAIDSLDDMETLFAGIPLGEVSTSMTINSPAAMLLAFYVCVGEEQGVPRDELRGTIQTDILKEYIAQKEYIFPPEPSMRLVTDMVEFCAAEMPKWHPISISGYHIREAGSTAAQELAFTLADGFTYVDWAIERGLDVDEFAPRLSFFFNAHLDFFEEIAKYRAARRIWARELRDRYGAKQPALVADALPHADRRRVADRAAAGGEHRPHGARGARGGARRHAVAAHELLRRGARAADRGRGADRAAHAAGDRARDRRREHDRPARRLVLRRAPDERARGRGVRLLRPDREARRRRRRRSRRTSSSARSPRRRSATSPRSRRSSGSSSASTATSSTTSGRSRSCSIDPALEQQQIDRVQALRARRDSPAVEAALARLKEDAARDDRNLMPPIVDASRAYVTMGEMCDALREVWGVWRETPVF